MTIDPIDRFVKKVRIDEDGCWRWEGALVRGYGVFKVKGKMLKAHRFMFQHGYGPIRKGMQLDHLCRITSCVNPEHLEEVTAQENTLRGNSIQAVNARKTRCVHGHLFSDLNTYVDKRGDRACKRCTFERAARWRKTEKAKAYLRTWYQNRKKERNQCHLMQIPTSSKPADS